MADIYHCLSSHTLFSCCAPIPIYVFFAFFPGFSLHVFCCRRSGAKKRPRCDPPTLMRSTNHRNFFNSYSDMRTEWVRISIRCILYAGEIWFRWVGFCLLKNNKDICKVITEWNTVLMSGLYLRHCFTCNKSYNLHN